MTDSPRPMGRRLGLYADKIERRRIAMGLDPSGFRQDGTDPAAADKEAMERTMYRRADEHMWFRDALGGQGKPPSEDDEAS